MEKKLEAKRGSLKAEFAKHQKEVERIDNLLRKLSKDRQQHADTMIMLRGQYALIDELIGTENNDTKKHGDTTNVQGKEG